MQCAKHMCFCSCFFHANLQFYALRCLIAAIAPPIIHAVHPTLQKIQAVPELFNNNLLELSGRSPSYPQAAPEHFNNKSLELSGRSPSYPRVNSARRVPLHLFADGWMHQSNVKLLGDVQQSLPKFRWRFGIWCGNFRSHVLLR